MSDAARIPELPRLLEAVEKIRPVIEADAAASEALRALREAASALSHSRRASVTLKAGEAVFAWLEADHIGWREAWSERLGPLPTLQRDDAAALRAFSVRAD